MWGRAHRQAPRAKIMITTYSDCGSASWINLQIADCVQSQIERSRKWKSNQSGLILKNYRKYNNGIKLQLLMGDRNGEPGHWGIVRWHRGAWYAGTQEMSFKNAPETGTWGSLTSRSLVAHQDRERGSLITKRFGSPASWPRGRPGWLDIKNHCLSDAWTLLSADWPAEPQASPPAAEFHVAIKISTFQISTFQNIL